MDRRGGLPVVFAGKVPQDETGSNADFFIKAILFNHLGGFSSDRAVDLWGGGGGVCSHFLRQGRSCLSSDEKAIFLPIYEHGTKEHNFAQTFWKNF